MMNWSRSPWTDAGQIMALLDRDNGPGEAAGKPLHEWFGTLVSGGDVSQAIMFMAQALPRYECVVWGTQALIDIAAADRNDPVMIAVLRWVDNPDDSLRRLAEAAAEREHRNTAAKLLALAVQFSGGSLAAAEFPPVLPPPEVCAKMVATALVTGIHSRPDPDAAARTVLAIGEKMLLAQ
jgi:hypothetical protein